MDKSKRMQVTDAWAHFRADESLVRSVINAYCVGQYGDLTAEGQHLEETLRYAFRNHSRDALDAARSSAFNIKASADSLRKAGRVPVIYRERRVRIGGAA